VAECARPGGFRLEIRVARKGGEDEDEPVVVAADAESERRASGGFAGEGSGGSFGHDDLERNALLLEAGRERTMWSAFRQERQQ
jgi:hypothetical protein